MKLLWSLLLLVALGACKHTDSTLQYLGNEGVAAFHDDTTLLFDPMFNTDYGIYALVPDATRDALLAGAPPFENIAFRVTVGDEASVAHLGDADPNLLHFELHREQWHEHTTDVALPPYWFFNSKMGNQILQEYVRPKHSTGIHVPSSYADPANIPEDLAGYDLFTRPGEAREWPESPE